MKKILWWLPTIIYISLILTLSFKPAPKLPSVGQIDKLAHASAYALLAFLSALSFARTGFKRTVLPAVSLAVLVGAGDEFFQAFNPVRTSSLYDLMADGAGALIGVAISRKILRRKIRSI
ncbi:MAG: VanZ family protein [Nitrospirota bacterium]